MKKLKYKKNLLFVTYDSIKTPILHSQGIPLLINLTKNNYKCGIVTYEDNITKKEIQNYTQKAAKWGIKWHRLKNRYSFISPASLLDIIQGFFYILYLILKEKYYIIHCRSYIAEFSGLLAAKLLRRKNIFDMRGLYPDEYAMSGYIKKRGMLYKFYKFIEFIEIKFSDAIVVITNRFKSYIKRLYFKDQKELFNNKVYVILNCADLEKFKYDKVIRSHIRRKLKLQNRLVFVYSGSLAKWHLWQQSIDFFSIIQETVPDIFYLFLTYKNISTVQNYFNQKNISNNNYIVLNAKPDEIPQYLYAGDLGIIFMDSAVVPIQIASPIKFAEFLASGLGIIANSGISDICELIKENNVGLCYTLNELKDEKQVLKKYNSFNNTIKLNKIKKASIELAQKKFDLNLAIRTYKNIYLNL